MEALGHVSQATVLGNGWDRGAITICWHAKARRCIAVGTGPCVLSAQLRMNSAAANVEIIRRRLLENRMDTVFGLKPWNAFHILGPTFRRTSARPCITSRPILLVRLFEHTYFLARIVIMVQKEAGGSTGSLGPDTMACSL